jgi:hypothetical protein
VQHTNGRRRTRGEVVNAAPAINNNNGAALAAIDGVAVPESADVTALITFVVDIDNSSGAGPYYVTMQRNDYMSVLFTDVYRQMGNPVRTMRFRALIGGDIKVDDTPISLNLMADDIQLGTGGPVTTIKAH